ncbi:hypothetical protein NPIL_129211 [Nephila pilipes]|uniref:Uncharacterized protein n=1 Tax=Nephila pilipes TaxID=299642 RepID=A0A8X6JIA8_NEPPI|nr:hypothetical protein NPIL_129211 [Nephila pilipes]
MLTKSGEKESVVDFPRMEMDKGELSDYLSKFSSFSLTIATDFEVLIIISPIVIRGNSRRIIAALQEKQKAKSRGVQELFNRIEISTFMKLITASAREMFSDPSGDIFLLQICLIPIPMRQMN